MLSESQQKQVAAVTSDMVSSISGSNKRAAPKHGEKKKTKKQKEAPPATDTMDLFG